MISDEKLEQMARLYAEQFDVGTREHAEDDYVSGLRAAEEMSEARITELESAVRDMADAISSGSFPLAANTLEKHRALIEALKKEST
jgi:hypothetical protein